MIEDNTPTVTARRRKPSGQMRKRLDTVRKLRALGSQKKAVREKAKQEALVVKPIYETDKSVPATANDQPVMTIRAPKVKKLTLATPPVPKAKFRKRQINKSWLPTHLFHAKRAHMTPPKEPLWRFAIPLRPVTKSYRPTHRAANERGAVVWDTSYIATIGLEGQQRSIDGMLRALGVGNRLSRDAVPTDKGEKWQQGTRVLNSFLFSREQPHQAIAPVTIIWCVPTPTSGNSKGGNCMVEQRSRKVFLRTHPSAFHLVWEELLRLAKIAKPQVIVEDLRFEIGSIEITGPGSTEALLGALWPSPGDDGSPDPGSEHVETMWTHLAGVTNPAMLPQNALLGFAIQDPRLHHPPRTIKLPETNEEQTKLLELLGDWPVEASQISPDIFDRRLRHAASSTLPSQKAVNRRKALATPGQYPSGVPKDPRIPALLYCSRVLQRKQGSWNLLLPWKCVQPVWYSLMYYPLSIGGQPRFGGLQEKRQLLFESSAPWFPGDFPGAKAGWEWELEERKKRKLESERRPKSKRINWNAVDLGDGKKGEVGLGWACDWERLVQVPPRDLASKKMDDAEHKPEALNNNDSAETTTRETSKSIASSGPVVTHMTTVDAEELLRQGTGLATNLPSMSALATVRISLLTRGVPQTCARIYRLPTSIDMRESWLALHPDRQPQRSQRRSKNNLPPLSKDAPAHIVQQRLAQSLLEPPQPNESSYPPCPGEEDLVGFVTTGNFNLGEGQGTGVGSVLMCRVLPAVRQKGDMGRLCVVRNAGNSTGRLARWDLV